MVKSDIKYKYLTFQYILAIRAQIKSIMKNIIITFLLCIIFFSCQVQEKKNLEQRISTDDNISTSEQQVRLSEKERVLALKKQLFDNYSGDKDLKKEKDILFDIWDTTYKTEITEGDTSPHIDLYLSTKDQNGQDIHINNSQQGYTVEITLIARDRESDEVLWTIEFDYTPLDINNISVLMME